MKGRNRFNKLLNSIPLIGYFNDSRSFLMVDTSGRIVIQDCDCIKSFTDRLLIITQGELLVTFTGEGLQMKNVSLHSGELTGKVVNITVDRIGGNK